MIGFRLQIEYCLLNKIPVANTPYCIGKYNLLINGGLIEDDQNPHLDYPPRIILQVVNILLLNQTFAHELIHISYPCISTININRKSKLHPYITNIQSNVNLLSIVFSLYDVIITDWAHTVVDSLTLSDLNSDRGIQVVVEKANSNPPMLNLVRPAVVRKYYGWQQKESNIRCTYPLMTSLGNVSVGTDPHNFVTCEIYPHMKSISKKLHEMLLTNREHLNLNSVDLSEPFNHCTVLIHYTDKDIGRKSHMGFHSDCTYKTKHGGL